MISSKRNPRHTFLFETDNLLVTLMDFSDLEHGEQIIFAGDGAQQPPAGDHLSAALRKTFFHKQGLRNGSTVPEKRAQRFLRHKSDLTTEHAPLHRP